PGCPISVVGLDVDVPPKQLGALREPLNVRAQGWRESAGGELAPQDGSRIVCPGDEADEGEHGLRRTLDRKLAVVDARPPSLESHVLPRLQEVSLGEPPPIVDFLRHAHRLIDSSGASNDRESDAS